jgi:hypothetical protein
MGNGLKLLLMIFIGFLLIEIGLTGALGSMLGAIVVPSYMQTQTPGQSLSNIPVLGQIPGLTGGA